MKTINASEQYNKQTVKTSAELEKDRSKMKEHLKYQRDKDREPVKGIFRFHEVPGGMMEFVFKAYKEDEVEKYSLIDGHVYTVPLGVARHLNKNCFYPVHKFMTDEYGKPTQKIGEKVRRCSFQSLEFVDIEDLEPEKCLITVEKVI